MISITETLQQSLPLLFGQFATALGLLGAGIAIYMLVTPYNEWRLVREGNVAAGVLVAGTLIALALPLAATLATSYAAIDILLWGIVALVVQLATFLAATFLIRDLRGMIEAGNVSAALVLAGIQIAVALLNAAAMAG